MINRGNHLLWIGLGIVSGQLLLTALIDVSARLANAKFSWPVILWAAADSIWNLIPVIGIGFVAVWFARRSAETSNRFLKSVLYTAIVLVGAAFALKYFDSTFTLGQSISETQRYALTTILLVRTSSWDLFLAGGLLGTQAALGLWRNSQSNLSADSSRHRFTSRNHASAEPSVQQPSNSRR
jgi:hypothetical protein